MRALLRHVPVPSFRSPFKSSSSGLPGPTGASTTASACSAKGERTTLPFAAREGLHERILESAIHDSEKHDVSSDDDDDDEDCSLDSAEFAMRSRRLSSSEIPPLSEFLDPQRMAAYEKLYSMEASDSSVTSSSDYDDDCSLDSAEFAMRSRTLCSSEIPPLSEFLDPQRMAAYEKFYSMEASDSSVTSSSDYDDDCSLDSAEFAMRSRTLCSSEIPPLSDFLDPRRMAAYEKFYSMEASDSSVTSSSNYDYDDRKDAPVAEKGDTEEIYSGPLQPLRTSARRDFPAPCEYLTREELLSVVSEFN
eukprot:TRINITY_DN4471_c0_g1_i1.p1 TRINITY_DN4471_c0_g1~~TRINITY_DN4471_c0_g1_i1.p1  ORF type:complete len:341 (+),score=35.70 TRINITY_DN4471_c0_g1_i1:111-1025(+)